MTGSIRVMSRRTFLRDLGHGAVALTIIGLTGCGTNSSSNQPTASGKPGIIGSFDPLTYDGNLDQIEAFWCEQASTSLSPVVGSNPDPTSVHRWAGVGTPNSHGYILVRGGEATVVDTGSWCVPDVIEGGLAAVGLDWSAVGAVIVTHKHPDHWVGLRAALELAPDAAVFAGAADIPHIACPREVVAVGAGDRVMDLAVIPTPGHTPGHIAVHDEAAGVLVVGDAIGGADSTGTRLGGLLPTSEDLAQAQASLATLSGLSFDTLLPGHGFPLVSGAWQRLNDFLAAG
jgi:glyoxylase-like metal-dependent hydrolase (beta-lactamase superfamily II)